MACNGAQDVPRNPRQLPPWSGGNNMNNIANSPTRVGVPPFVPVAPSIKPIEQPSEYPIQSATVQNPNLFPPVCIRSHWDPTKIIQRTLPQAMVPTPLDPRPWTKVCLEYVTTQDFQEAPRPSDSVVFPSGGSVYPPNRYKEAIDSESELRRLDRPLGTCERDQYFPPLSGDLYVPNKTVPDRGQPNNRFIEELAFPMACMRDAKPYDCVAEAQEAAWMRSPMPFNNATKQSRYAVQRKDLVRQTYGEAQPIPQEMMRLS